MKSISWYISFTGLMTSLSAGSAFATELTKERSYDSTACSSVVSNTIILSETNTAPSYELMSTTRRNPPFSCVEAAQLASLPTRSFDQSIVSQYLNSLSRATMLNPIYYEPVLKPLGGATTGGSHPSYVSDQNNFYVSAVLGGTSGGGNRSPLPPPTGYTTGRLIFEDTFTGGSLDSTKWIPVIADQNGIWRQSVRSPYSAVNAGGFNAEYYDPAQISTGPSGLKIVATRSDRFAGYTWKSGAICTHGKFTFAGGYAQIRMKQPSVSTGGWPAFWHLEGGAEIDTQEGGFLNGSVPVDRVLANALIGATSDQQFFDAGVDQSADYHVWGMEYIPGVSIKFYFDGVLKRTVTANVPIGAMTLLISLSIANGSASAWHTAYDSSTPATLELNVTDVQVYRW